MASQGDTSEKRTRKQN